MLLAGRSLLWTFLLPGLYAGYLPWRYFGVREALATIDGVREWIGVAGFAAGALLLAACIWEFAVSGRGTLSPVDPTESLVVKGLYRYVRNPMYLSVTLIVASQVLLTGSRGLALYWAIWFAATNIFIIAYEEPTMQRKFPVEYAAYTAAVRRWIPRLTPYRTPLKETE